MDADRPQKWKGLLAAALTLALMAGSVLPPAPRPAPLTVDGSAAAAMLDLLEAAAQGEPWSRARIAELLATPGFAGMLAHHRRLDEGVTGASMLQVLATLQEDEILSVKIGRMARMQAAYRAALERLPELRARLERLSDPALAGQAAERAQAALPRGAWLAARVYLIVDGYSPAYVERDSIYLDLLQLADPFQVEWCLAHELHHIGLASLLPEPCADPGPGIALDTLAGLVQEGSVTYWIDRWRGQPTAADLDRMQAFLLDLLEGRLRGEAIEARLADLLGYERGPLYRVGNAMIAELVARHGEAWVRERLADPVGLLRAYHQLGKWPGAARVLAALDSQRSSCPAWIGR